MQSEMFCASHGLRVFLTEGLDRISDSPTVQRSQGQHAIDGLRSGTNSTDFDWTPYGQS